MEETGEPRGIRGPWLLGGFTVLSRLAEHVAGTIYAGRDRSSDPRPVVLVVLAPAAASDPTVRDRFATAASIPVACAVPKWPDRC